MTDWTTLDVERLADALAAIYLEREFYSLKTTATWAARQDAEELLALVADKLDVARLARAIDKVFTNPYSATMAGQIAGEYALDFKDAERGVFYERAQRGITTFEVPEG